MNTRKALSLWAALLAAGLTFTPLTGDPVPIQLAKCTGDDQCKACKTCKACKHCAKEGGTCGVCRQDKPDKPGANR